MTKIILYHNPRCSKSRGALACLTETEVDFEIVEYLESPLSLEGLEGILAALDCPAADLVRKDGRFRELALSAENYQDAKTVAGLLVDHPELMERPIALLGSRAVIGRPPERVLELLQ